MPTIEIETTRTVRYSTNVEVTEDQAANFRQALEIGDKQEVEECLLTWVDSKYDVLDADEFEVLNTTIDGELI